MILLQFDNTNQVTQNPIQNLDKALFKAIFSRNWVFCLKL